VHETPAKADARLGIKKERGVRPALFHFLPQLFVLTGASFKRFEGSLTA
jgi:hypothetical protein